MFSDSTKQLLHLALLIGLIAAMAAIIPVGFGQDQKAPDTNEQYPHIDLDHPDNYVGQQVTLVGDVDKIHSDTAFVMEAKGIKDHILVIEISPDAHPEGEMKEGHPVTATGTIRRLDRAELEQEFGPIDFGTTPLAKFEGKPILVMGTRQTAQVQQQEPVQQFEREKPTEAKPGTPAPAPETQATPDESLPRTATPLPFIGLAGLLSLATGLGMQVFRRK